MPTTCTGGRKGKKSCTCTGFIPRGSKPHKCGGCEHRWSAHETTADTPPEDPKATTQGGKSYVKRMLKAIQSTSVLERAKKEMAQGFRPPIHIPAPVSIPAAKGKGKARQASGQVATRTSVKFCRIVFFPCGENNIQAFKTPTINSSALHPWITAGLVVEAEAPGFTFPLDWGTKQFNAWLRQLFPVLFSHFDAMIPGFKAIQNEPDGTGLLRVDYNLPYILVNKQRRKCLIVDEAHPTAEVYNANLSGEKSTCASFRSRTLFFVTKAPIANAILRKWFPASSAIPAIPGTVTPTLLTPSPSPSPSPPPSPLAGKKRSRSITHSSDDSNSNLDASNDLAAAEDEDTDVDTDDSDEGVEQRPAKRPCIAPLRSQGPLPPELLSEFVEGSSSGRTREVEDLTQRLQQSASFEDHSSTWVNNDEANMWNF